MLSVLAHNVGADSLPAPSWLLGYLGALAVLGAAAWLRGGWTTSRLAVATRDDELDDGASAAGPETSRWHLLGWSVGLVLLGLTLVAAFVGPDEAASNVSTLAVFRVWFYAVPLLSLLLGDVVRAVNPFQPVVTLLERLTGRRGDPDGAPPWTAAVFLVGFSWVFVAYHATSSPRVVGITVAAYAVAAVAGGVLWGRAWLSTGEAFGAISAALARVTGRAAPHPPGLLPLATVWIGVVTFDGLSQTKFWGEVLGSNRGWDQTLLNTVGLVWMTGIVAAVALVVLRVAEAGEREDEARPAASLAVLLGVALVPIAATWFLADNLPPVLAEGQSFLALLSDPIGEGWDLFGTIDMTIDYTIASADWVQWVQLAVLLAGHLGAVVLVHDGALARLGRRRGMRATWAVAVAAAASFVCASLLVLG